MNDDIYEQAWREIRVRDESCFLRYLHLIVYLLLHHILAPTLPPHVIAYILVVHHVSLNQRAVLGGDCLGEVLVVLANTVVH